MFKKTVSLILLFSLILTCLSGTTYAREVGVWTTTQELTGVDYDPVLSVGERAFMFRYKLTAGEGANASTLNLKVVRNHSTNTKIAVGVVSRKSNLHSEFYIQALSPGTTTITFVLACTAPGSYDELPPIVFDVKVEEPFQPLEFSMHAPSQIVLTPNPANANKIASKIDEHSGSLSSATSYVGFAIGGVGLAAAIATKGAALSLAASALGYVTSVVGVVSTYVHDYNEEKNPANIGWEPYPAKILVTIKNPNDYTVYSVKFNVTESNNGVDGTTFVQTGTNTVSEHIAIPGNTTRTFSYELQPEIIYSLDNYTSDFKLEASYRNSDTGKRNSASCTDSTAVSSGVNEEKYGHLPVAEPATDGRTAAFLENHGMSGTVPACKVVTVQCPVNVNILDASGNVLTTIESYDEEIFTADGIAAYAIDDAKAVVIEHEYLDSYRISIDAVGDGSMTITSVDILEDGTYAMSHHAEVPLTTGDTFSADISDTSVTRIYSGAGEEIAADVVINRETVNTMLIEAGYSEKWLSSALEAVLMGLVTPELAENPQNDTTYEEYAAALLAMMENFIGVGAGYYANYFYELDGRTDMTAMDILAELGVTGMTDFTGDITSPITRGDMAIMTTSMLESMCLRYAFDEVSWTDVANGNVAWSAGFMYDIGAMCCETEGEFLPTGTVTHEESIHALYMLWTYLQDPQLPPEIDPATEYTDKEIIKGVQAALNELGYDCGTPDGVSGANTAAAITEFQTVNELAVTGTITEELLMWLGWMGYVIPR